MYANKQITCFPVRRKMENMCVFRKRERERESVCVCVCEGEREREK